MALVITLILLSVTLIMAVAFLAISTRERNAVTTTTDTAGSRLAADAALAHAEAQIVASLFTTNTSAYNFGLLVSTNYINGYGFNPAAGANPTNVNFSYKSDGTAFTSGDLIQDIANLYYLPRAPVYLSNLVTHTVENRFYLDLNRNGIDDPNGYLSVLGRNGGFLHPDGTEDNNPVNVLTNFQVGDPEWIGVLDHPDAPHGPNNRFVARYAFIAVPIGNALDINAIHNQAYDTVANRSLIPPNDEFFRNQGVGSWEINLAAFLADLNTNEWGQIIDAPSYLGGPASGNGFYQYNEPFSLDNGRAYNDALSLLAYRYAYNYQLLAPVGGNSPNGLFTTVAVFPPFQNNVDVYDDGPLQKTFADINVNGQNILLPWAGADNTNQFFTLDELFNTNETATFGSDLLNANESFFGGTTNSTYDRYTFYRMLGELGSDSAPESGKINVNYSNAVVNYAFVNGAGPNGYLYPTNIAIVQGAETNFMGWTATNFFTASADRMLRLYTTNWFQSNPSNYLLTFYGLSTATNYCPYSYNYVNSSGITVTVTNDPNGLGLTIPFLGIANTIPAFGITNIPVWVNGQFVYTPAVNRLLQLAANIYDTVYYTSNYTTLGGMAYLPDVFRPIFNVVGPPNPAVGTNVCVYIRGYAGVGDMSFLASPIQTLNLSYGPSVIATLAAEPNDLVFGVPLIVGAKKGFPNFNEFYMESAFQLTRKIMVTRSSTNVTLNTTFTNYEMFNLSLTNQFGVECWNSYRSNYTRATDIYVTNFLIMTLTNDENFSYTANLIAGGSLLIPSTSYWPGTYNSLNPNPQSFLTNFNTIPTNFAAVALSMYRFNTTPDVEETGHVGPYATTNLNLPYETHITGAGYGQYPQPHWGLAVTNNLQVIMVDDASGRLIDYVQLSGPNSIRDLTAEIQNGYDMPGSGNDYSNQWDTSIINGVPGGITSQLNVSQGQGSPTNYDAAHWSQDQKQAYDQMNGFLVFLNGAGTPLLTYPGYTPDPTQIGIAETTNAMQAPYTPSALVVQNITWQANDPLVHYLSTDLNNPTAGNGLRRYLNWPGNLGKLNQRYQPWGGNPKTGVGTNWLAIKDPLVTCSDDWNFPTNKFPTVGWLGRVHRGTPWQTVYLKASDVLFPANGASTWVNWTGNVNTNDAVNNAPKKDRRLFDLFTTAFNDNATRGQLSVNQPHLAAWSALFSGVMALSNNALDSVVQTSSQGASSMTAYTNFPISPAGIGTNSAMWQLWNGISQSRAAVSNADGVVGAFEHEGDILFVPQLTERSPFLNWNDSVQQQKGISDEMYEWLPQQVMSLLHEGSPRYVIYCYGQSLKPAPNSLVTSGGTSFEMCTNYQVVAESAGRAVVRVEGVGTPTPHIVVESFNPLPPD